MILAGGRGNRMGGIDKGLALHDGLPLALHALRRLAPQVGSVAINANRNLAAYAEMAVAVWPDAVPGHPGPLAGMLTGMERCATPYLLAVPCDVPSLPLDLAARLASALDANVDLAIAVTAVAGERRTQPVFCLMRTSLAAGLRRFLDSGERRVGAWTQRHRCAEALFTSASDFANLNTDADLARANGQG